MEATDYKKLQLFSLTEYSTVFGALLTLSTICTLHNHPLLKVNNRWYEKGE